jgi:hypothetical protein
MPTTVYELESYEPFCKGGVDCWVLDEKGGEDKASIYCQLIPVDLSRSEF